MKNLLILSALITPPALAVLPGDHRPFPSPTTMLTQRIPIQPGAWQITELDTRGQKISAEEHCVQENEWQAFMHDRAASGEEGCEPIKFTQTHLKTTATDTYLRVGYEETCQQGNKTITHSSAIDQAVSTRNTLTQYKLTTTTRIAGQKTTDIQRYRYLRLGNCVGYHGEIVGE